MRSKVSTAILALCLTSCTTLQQVNDRNLKWYSGNTPDFDNKDVNAYFYNEHQLVLTIAGWQNIPVPPQNGNWKPFAVAGMSYAHDRCTEYLESIFYLNRVRGFASSELSSTHVLAAAALQAAHAAQSLATIVASGFSFANDTMTNLGNGLLYGLEPGTIKKLVADQQKPIEDQIKSGEFHSQSEAMDEVRRYAEVCLPVSIAENVNEKLTSSTPDQGTPDKKTPDNGTPDKGGPKNESGDKIKNQSTHAARHS